MNVKTFQKKIKVFHEYFPDFFDLLKKSNFLKPKNFEYMFTHFQLDKHWSYHGGYEEYDLLNYFHVEDDDEEEVVNNIISLKKEKKLKQNKILNGLNSYIFKAKYNKFNLFQEEIYNDIKKAQFYFL